MNNPIQCPKCGATAIPSRKEYEKCETTCIFCGTKISLPKWDKPRDTPIIFY
jgi:transcription initiation factor TFIIIB Brf1 subunit/transcription initiation factor TFIIB